VTRTGTVFFRAWAAAAVVGLIGLAGCPSESRPPSGADAGTASGPELNGEGGEPMAIEVTSTAFSEGEKIPVKYAGDGEDVSPPISWSNLPEGTKELVLICDDPNAPTPEPWVHWVIYKIPVDPPGLPEGVKTTPRLKEPAGALQGKNSWPSGQTVGYRGPAPPPGHGVHHYFFRLYAMKGRMVIEPGKDKKALLEEMSGHVLGEGVLMGTYER
jgi:Raf kinase inhibitor-like YbhB/YbcL family protein